MSHPVLKLAEPIAAPWSLILQPPTENDKKEKKIRLIYYIFSHDKKMHRKKQEVYGYSSQVIAREGERDDKGDKNMF